MAIEKELMCLFVHCSINSVLIVFINSFCHFSGEVVRNLLIQIVGPPVSLIECCILILLSGPLHINSKQTATCMSVQNIHVAMFTDYNLTTVLSW